MRVYLVPLMVFLVMISAGSSHAAKIVDVDSSSDFLLDDSGHIWRWDGVVVGTDGTVSITKPYLIDNLSDVKQTASCDIIYYALKKDGTVWALDSYFYMENGTYKDGYMRLADMGLADPLQVPGFENITAISGKSSSLIAVTDDHRVLGLGGNNYGQLGSAKNSGTDSMVTYPVQVSGLDNVRMASMGDLHATAVTTDGTVWTWGSNHLCQLGRPILSNESYDYQFEPFHVQGLNDVMTVSAGRDFTIALGNDGTVSAWGRNDEGQVGNGLFDTKRSYSTPQRVKDLDHVTAVSAGAWYTLALRDDGTVWAWGKNNRAMLGDGTTKSKNIPVQVQGLKNIVNISASNTDRCLAVDEDGNVWAWGVGHITVRPGEKPDKYVHSVIVPILVMSGDNSTTGCNTSSGSVAQPSTDLAASNVALTPSVTGVVNVSFTASPAVEAQSAEAGLPIPGMGFGSVLLAVFTVSVGSMLLGQRKR